MSLEGEKWNISLSYVEIVLRENYTALDDNANNFYYV